MPTFSDFLLRPASGFLSVGLWVQIVNNATNATFTSTTATDANGKFTINGAPTGNYTIYTGPSGSGPWTSIGDTNYFVPPSLNDTQVWTGSQTIYHSNQTVTEAVLVSGVDASLGEDVYVTLTANRVVGAPLNPVTGQHIHFIFTENGTGGWKLTWNAVFSLTNWALNTAASALTEATFTYNGTNWLFALNPPIGTATSPVQGVVRDWGGALFNAQAPQNPSGSADATGGSVTQASIASTLSAAGAGTAYFAAGTFLFNARLQLAVTGSTLRGSSRAGTIFKQANGSNLGFILDEAAGTHHHFCDFTMDGNKAQNATSTGSGITLYTNNSSVMNVRVLNTHGAGLISWGVTGALFAFNHVETPDGDGISLGGNPTPTSLSRVIGNRVDTPGGSGIFTAQSGDNLLVVALNTVLNAGNIGIALGSSNSLMAVLGNVVSGGTANVMDTGSCFDISVVGNIVTGPTIGINPDTGYRQTIVGNVARNCGIALYNGNADAAAITGRDNIVSSNIASGAGVNPNTGNFDFDGGTYVLVIGNLSKNATGGATAAGFAVHKNNPNTALPDRYLFIGNIGYDDQRIKTQGYGLSVDASERSVVVFHNELRGNLTGAINDAGPDTYVHGNMGYNPRGVLTPPAVPATTVIFQNPFNVDCMVYIKGGTITDIAVGGLPAPANWSAQPTLSQAASGGTLGAATYAYRVAARNTAGHTVESAEVTIVVAAGATNTVTVTLPTGTGLRGVTGWDIYGRTSGAELLMATNWQKPRFIDDGSVTPSGAMPGTDTTGNTSTGISAAAPAGAVHSIYLGYGQSIKGTWSVLPTWVWQGF